MKILDEIVAHKRKEIAERKDLYPLKLLEQSVFFATRPVSLSKYLQREDKVGIIAEIKRQSPSRGVLNAHIRVEDLSIGYMQAGASALSVLTDGRFFGGKNEDLTAARRFNFCPILRKEFILDEYQLVESKSIGADAVLIIACILDPARIKLLAGSARRLGLEVLLEVRSREELERSLCGEIDLVGVNNRNLDSLEIDGELSSSLAQAIPEGMLKISESGIDSAETILELKRRGFKGFLIGEAFMRHARPEQACARLVEEVRRLAGRGAEGARKEAE